MSRLGIGGTWDWHLAELYREGHGCGTGNARASRTSPGARMAVLALLPAGPIIGRPAISPVYSAAMVAAESFFDSFTDVRKDQCPTDPKCEANFSSFSVGLIPCYVGVVSDSLSCMV